MCFLHLWLLNLPLPDIAIIPYGMVTTRGQAAQAGEHVTQGKASGQATSQDGLKCRGEGPRDADSRLINIGNGILFLFVGPQVQLVTIHNELMPEATRNYIREKNTGQAIYQLPDDDVSIVETYRLFLYTNKIFSIAAGNQEYPDDGVSETHADAEWTQLAHCYIFGITVKNERFANAAISALIDKMTERDRYPTGIASEVYACTLRGDNLRRFIVDLHVYKGQGSWIREPHGDADAPREFVQDVINGLAVAGSSIYEEDVQMPWVRGPCEYHEHTVTPRCGR